ncbi:hypothetical protein CYMTET_24737 [Cymbomonas tetramitiformis]|uniref:Uncharacterized protein n=1 Tax=Cymbomonas tetramitiformis TaxID=36881 RepID=A0AAE0KZX2_9CHLO|nr:hypothetical protein CYMTET_24737 [Cymbomonas tetramitiformis]
MGLAVSAIDLDDHSDLEAATREPRKMNLDDYIKAGRYPKCPQGYGIVNEEELTKCLTGFTTTATRMGALLKEYQSAIRLAEKLAYEEAFDKINNDAGNKIDPMARNRGLASRQASYVSMTQSLPEMFKQAQTFLTMLQDNCLVTEDHLAEMYISNCQNDMPREVEEMLKIREKDLKAPEAMQDSDEMLEAFSNIQARTVKLSQQFKTLKDSNSTLRTSMSLKLTQTEEARLELEKTAQIAQQKLEFEDNVRKVEAYMEENNIEPMNVKRKLLKRGQMANKFKKTGKKISMIAALGKKSSKKAEKAVDTGVTGGKENSGAMDEKLMTWMHEELCKMKEKVEELEGEEQSRKAAHEEMGAELTKANKEKMGQFRERQAMETYVQETRKRNTFLTKRLLCKHFQLRLLQKRITSRGGTMSMDDLQDDTDKSSEDLLIALQRSDLHRMESTAAEQQAEIVNLMEELETAKAASAALSAENEALEEANQELSLKVDEAQASLAANSAIFSGEDSDSSNTPQPPDSSEPLGAEEDPLMEKNRNRKVKKKKKTSSGTDDATEMSQGEEGVALPPIAEKQTQQEEGTGPEEKKTPGPIRFASTFRALLNDSQELEAMKAEEKGEVSLMMDDLHLKEEEMEQLRMNNSALQDKLTNANRNAAAKIKQLNAMMPILADRSHSGSPDFHWSEAVLSMRRMNMVMTELEGDLYEKKQHEERSSKAKRATLDRRDTVRDLKTIISGGDAVDKETAEAISEKITKMFQDMDLMWRLVQSRFKRISQVMQNDKPASVLLEPLEHDQAAKNNNENSVKEGQEGQEEDLQGSEMPGEDQESLPDGSVDVVASLTEAASADRSMDGASPAPYTDDAAVQVLFDGSDGTQKWEQKVASLEEKAAELHETIRSLKSQIDMTEKIALKRGAEAKKLREMLEPIEGELREARRKEQEALASHAAAVATLEEAQLDRSHLAQRLDESASTRETSMIRKMSVLSVQNTILKTRLKDQEEDVKQAMSKLPDKFSRRVAKYLKEQAMVREAGQEELEAKLKADEEDGGEEGMAAEMDKMDSILEEVKEEVEEKEAVEGKDVVEQTENEQEEVCKVCNERLQHGCPRCWEEEGGRKHKHGKKTKGQGKVQKTSIALSVVSHLGGTLAAGGGAKGAAEDPPIDGASSAEPDVEEPEPDVEEPQCGRCEEMKQQVELLQQNLWRYMEASSPSADKDSSPPSSNLQAPPSGGSEQAGAHTTMPGARHTVSTCSLAVVNAIGQPEAHPEAVRRSSSRPQLCPELRSLI